MSDGAVHLEQCVLPEVPVRHWICTFPWGVRAVLGYDKRLCARAVSAFVSELSRSLRRRANKLLGLASVSEAHTGAVAAIQRTDSALRLNVHVHVLALDGVYVRERANGPLVFHALPTPSRTEVAEVARRTAERLARAFKAQGRPSPWGDPDADPDATGAWS
jgi:Putative transposase